MEAETVKQETNTTPGWVKTIGYGAAAAAAFYVFSDWDRISTRYLGAAYTCENMVAEVLEIAEKNTAAGMPKLIGLVEKKGVSSSDDRTECAATGVFSNGMRYPIAYRAYIEDGQWWIFFEPAA